MPPLINLKGQRFGMLRVLRDSGKRTRSNAVLWLCRCKCGTKKLVWGVHLRNGQIVSCGSCSKIKHGFSYHPLYDTYRSILSRCFKSQAKSFRYYGGRGITVCTRWLGKDGFANFVQDVGPRPEGKTLDRINNNENYEPGNVRWATSFVQAQNRRCVCPSPLSDEPEDIFAQ